MVQPGRYGKSLDDRFIDPQARIAYDSAGPEEKQKMGRFAKSLAARPDGCTAGDLLVLNPFQGIPITSPDSILKLLGLKFSLRREQIRVQARIVVFLRPQR